MGLIEEQNNYLIERIKNNNKLNFIDNIESFNLSKAKQREFVNFYWNNLDLNLEEAYEEFKKREV